MTLRDFGAKGDGRTDDAPAIQRALKSGCTVRGENLSYRITAALRPISNSVFADATLIQAIPAGGLKRPIYANAISNLTLSNIKIDRGKDPFFGLGPTTDPYRASHDIAGIWISNSSNITLNDVEVYGDGVGFGIILAQDTNVHLVRPYVHDMRWASQVQPENESLVGIMAVRSSHVVMDSPRVANLTPAAINAISGRAAGRRNNMTDGIDSSGTQEFIVNDPEIWNVGEGIDISGKFSTTFRISGGNLHDIDSYCYKVTHKQGPGVIRNSTATRCGLGGFVLSGPVSGVKLVNDNAINIGQGSQWPNKGKFGFSLEFSYGAMPSNITIANCKSIDSQASPTTYDGFYYQGGHGPAQNVLITGSSAHGFSAFRDLWFREERRREINLVVRVGVQNSRRPESPKSAPPRSIGGGLQ